MSSFFSSNDIKHWINLCHLEDNVTWYNDVISTRQMCLDIHENKKYDMIERENQDNLVYMYLVWYIWQTGRPHNDIEVCTRWLE